MRMNDYIMTRNYTQSNIITKSLKKESSQQSRHYKTVLGYLSGISMTVQLPELVVAVVNVVLAIPT